MYVREDARMGQYHFPGGDPAGFQLPGGFELPPFEWGAAGDWLELGQETLQVYGSITGGDTGGGACWTGYDNRPFTEPCPGTPDYDAVLRAVKRAPQAAIDTLTRYLREGNYGKGPRSREGLMRVECVPYWVKAVLGGKGCVASTFPEAPRWFRQFVEQYGAPESPQDKIPGSEVPPGTPMQAGLGFGALLAVGLGVLVARHIGKR